MRESTIQIGALAIRVIEAGPTTGPSVLLLHGWPQYSHAWRAVMEHLQNDFRVAAIDLPGVGQSRGVPPNGAKRTLAEYVRAVQQAAQLEDVTLVGHDVGGQIVYAFVRAFPGAIARAAILNVTIPGVRPWSEVVRNPRIWHFGFHAVPQLPELLVSGHQQRYFDFFFDAISADPAAISGKSRRLYAEAYRSADSLKAGFDWYRAFQQDEKDNADASGARNATPILCVRGDAEAGDPDSYFSGLREAGLVELRGTVIPRCGHFSLDEQPQAVADALREFMSS